MRETDTLHRFMLEEAGVRGEWVHLDAAWQALLERHDYPPVVRDLLGQAYAAVALTAATLKFDGSLILQVTGTGPVHMIVAQADGQGRLRGLARFRETPPDDATLAQCAGDNARLMLTLDPGDGGERYQGVVELEGETLADAMNVYFERSEQLPTRLWLAANDRSAAGMLLQAVPARAVMRSRVTPRTGAARTSWPIPLPPRRCWSWMPARCSAGCSPRSVCVCSTGPRSSFTAPARASGWPRPCAASGRTRSAASSRSRVASR